MAEISLRTMQRDDWGEVAELIYLSTNQWYETHGMDAIFQGGPEVTRIFCQEYEVLDPGCCILAFDPVTELITGSCFYHPRPTHMSLGIMNVHPDYFGHGIAGRLLGSIMDRAEQEQKPIRLVSSAMNLDSYSLYTKSGFVPRMTFQDMIITVPDEGFPADVHVRDATLADLPEIVKLELGLQHINREKDYRHLLENGSGIWHLSVYEDEQRTITGVLGSVVHPGSNMLGPGVACTESQAAALIRAELGHHRGRSPVVVIPVTCGDLIQDMYALGARNCEMHVNQVRGTYTTGSGVLLPTFMPESC
jgi:GNAT superfamily N-acetyltransferase